MSQTGTLMGFVHRRRRGAELFLLVLALMVGIGAYAAVGLGVEGVVPADLLGYGGWLTALIVAAHITVRIVAPYADPVLLPLVAALNGLGLAVIRRLDLRIADREFVVLLGPSGCGKTTTLRAIAGLEEIDKGTITIDGRPVQDLPPGERDIAFVFQLFALYPHLTAFDNIAFPLRATGESREEIARKVRDVAKSLRIEGLLAKPTQALRLTQRLLRRGSTEQILERMELENGHFAERLTSDEVKQAIAAFFAARAKPAPAA